MSIKYTTEEIVKQFKLKHGNKFNYSKVKYVNAKTKVTIICKEHGDFEQSPDKHKRGNRCPLCSGKGKTPEMSIKEFNRVFSDTYDYSLSVFKTSVDKIEIICSIHGSFFKTPEKHRIGQGCQKCAEILRVSKRKSNITDVINEFEKSHGNYFDYNKVEYVTTDTKVIITCPAHGDFKQTPAKHISGKGCPKCSGRNLTEKDILLLFRNTHGDKYHYEFSEDLSIKAKVRISCPKHGVFLQTIDSHKHGSGCTQCGIEKNTDLKRRDISELISKFRTIHGDEYDYSKVDYSSMHGKIEIGCPVHGPFFQMPSGHLSGKGCHKCAGRGLSVKEYIIRYKEVHGNRYDYSKIKTIDKVKDKIEIGCKVHGVFRQTADSHFQGVGCPFCTLTPQSKQELMINFELQQFFPKINPRGYKTRVDGKLWSIDIYLPSVNLGIEFDGSYWHKEKVEMDKVKTLQLKGEGFEIIRVRQEPLVRIFETDIMSKNPFNAKQVVNDVLIQIMKLNDLDKGLKTTIKHYISLKKLKNQDALNEYIEEIMEEKESKK